MQHDLLRVVNKLRHALEHLPPLRSGGEGSGDGGGPTNGRDHSGGDCGDELQGQRQSRSMLESGGAFTLPEAGHFSDSKDSNNSAASGVVEVQARKLRPPPPMVEAGAGLDPKGGAGGGSAHYRHARQKIERRGSSHGSESDLSHGSDLDEGSLGHDKPTSEKAFADDHKSAANPTRLDRRLSLFYTGAGAGNVMPESEEDEESAQSSEERVNGGRSSVGKLWKKNRTRKMSWMDRYNG